ncbi:hypothetical protein GOBAR_AA23304 [Gossypium barbadense]|uniref:Methyltransferase domain-containing protein n=1 Tax=Gossypium barbadense TaxID=3634 RepID=A0A2P5X211_GOSBA|nr:hypothetical protein GOBAR_AA23304 [Gossypium barbadense]
MHGNQTSAQIKELEAHVTSLELELKSLQATNRDMAEQLENKASKAEKLGEQNIGLQSRISELEIMLEKREKEIFILMKKLEDDNSESLSDDEASNQVQRLIDEANTLQQQLESLHIQKAKLELQFERKKQKSSEKLNEMENQKSELKQMVEDLQRDLEAKGDEKNDLAGMDAAHGILGKHSSVVYSPKHLSPSFMETMACLFVAKFFQQFVSPGCIIFLEEGGRIFTFKGNMEKCPLKSVLKVHNPQFYWRIMKEADLGLADAYINGDFSFVDKDKGLLNLFQILVVNKETWFSPALFTTSISSAKYFTKHLLRQNTVTQARRNISRHYDLGNELFTLYLGETMQYSSGVFKTRIKKWHEVLDIGCGWGILAIEAVKRTGCKYTGITLSEKQLKFAEDKVKEAGLEMVEHVDKEYIEEFYRCCDQLLKKDGLFVLQFITLPEELSKEVQQTAGFIKEYIFPGGMLLSFNTHLSAMAAASGFCDVLALGFDDKFMRTWEYYFDYCAAGFKTGTLLDYQHGGGWRAEIRTVLEVVFSRADNFATLGDPYKGFPSAYSFMDT